MLTLTFPRKSASNWVLTPSYVVWDRVSGVFFFGCHLVSPIQNIHIIVLDGNTQVLFLLANFWTFYLIFFPTKLLCCQGSQALSLGPNVHYKLNV